MYFNVLVFSTLAAAARGGLLLVAIRRLHLRIRQKLFHSILHQEIEFFDTNQTGTGTVLYSKYVTRRFLYSSYKYSTNTKYLCCALQCVCDNCFKFIWIPVLDELVGEVTSRLTSDADTLGNLLALNINILLRNAIKVGTLLAAPAISFCWDVHLLVVVCVAINNKLSDCRAILSYSTEYSYVLCTVLYMYSYSMSCRFCSHNCISLIFGLPTNSQSYSCNFHKQYTDIIDQQFYRFV